MTRVWLRWVPAAAASAVIAAGALAVPLQAGAAVNLPDKTPQEVLAMIGDSTVDTLSGTLEQTSRLGLPDLSMGGSAAGDDAASALELVTGTHTARIYLDGPGQARVQVLDRLAERDLIVNGTDVWLYDSQENEATHLTLPADAGSRDAPAPGAPQTPAQTPAQLADKLLAELDPSTRVSVDDDTEVAGRTAYDLVLTPRGDGTLVGSVSIAVDSETGLPLRVKVQARGETEPAFELAFTALSLATPDAALFDFEPPAGADVKEQALPEPPSAGHGPKDPEHGDFTGTVSGTGWETMVELPAGSVPAELTASPLYAQATEAVDGGRLLSTSLVNVLITDDGRVFAGSVPAERLQAAAAGG